MAEQGINDPALMFAIYASTAATAAVNALKRNGLIDQSEVDKLVTNLTLCRSAAGTNPILIEHAELLTDLLQIPVQK